MEDKHTDVGVYEGMIKKKKRKKERKKTEKSYRWELEHGYTDGWEASKQTNWMNRIRDSNSSGRINIWNYCTVCCLCTLITFPFPVLNLNVLSVSVLLSKT